MGKTIKELPESERPFERFIQSGAGALSDRELLTVVIRSGGKDKRADEIALSILERCGKEGITNLPLISVKELQKLKGIGKVKAVQLACICELSKRIRSGRKIIGGKFLKPEDIFNYYNEIYAFEDREILFLLVLDQKNRVIHEEKLSIGTINMSVCEPREVFLNILKNSGVSFVLIHNHPSGDPSPSKEDIYITQKISQCGKLLGLPLLDHIIIGNNKYLSLKMEGIID